MPISQHVVDSEQGMADTFTHNGLLPGSIDVTPYFTDKFNADTTGN